MGSILLPCSDVYAKTMRLIGRIRLAALLELDLPDVHAAVRALHGELAAARWRSLSQAAEAFPLASRDGCRLLIDLDERHCVAVVINIRTEIAVIEYAGLASDRVPIPRRRARRG